MKLKKHRFRPRDRTKYGTIKFNIEAAPMGGQHKSPGLRGNFEACANVSGKHLFENCARGKTPRAALAKALRQLSSVVSKRRGTFKGIRK